MKRDQGRLDTLARRARFAALLPELRLRATRLIDENASVSPTSYDPTRTTASDGTSLWLEARATWALDRVLFRSEEVRIERLYTQRQENKQRRVQQVLRMLFRWQTAAVRLRDPAASYQECWAAWMHEQQAAAWLEILTDGWFSKWRRGRGLETNVDCASKALDGDAFHAPRRRWRSASRSTLPVPVRGSSDTISTRSGTM